IGGSFDGIGNDSIEGIACYVEGGWASYGSMNAYDGGIYKLKVINGDLYALGTFGYMDGSFCNGIAKRVGGHWAPVGSPLPEFVSPPWFRDAVEYQGRLVVTGTFYSLDGSVNGIMAYDGSSWQPLCDCMWGGMDQGACLAVYQGDLYLGGGYYYGSGNAGQGLMRYDGS